MDGRCPRCGGSDRVLIAPGYYECRSLVAVPEEPRFTPIGVEMVEVTVPCGQRYQEGIPGGPLFGICACGTGAIGSCGQCGRSVCGDHSRAGQQRLCVDCIRENHEQAAESAAAARSRIIERLLAIEDPIERLILTIKSLAEVDTTYQFPRYYFRDIDAVRSVKHAAWAELESRNVSPFVDDPNYSKRLLKWDTAAIGRWFVDRSCAKEIEADSTVTRRIEVPGRKRRESSTWKTLPPTPAWSFAAGGNTILILKDGSVLGRHGDGSDFPPMLSGSLLLDIGERLGLTLEADRPT